MTEDYAMKRAACRPSVVSPGPVTGGLAGTSTGAELRERPERLAQGARWVGWAQKASADALHLDVGLKHCSVYPQ